jgi:DNA-binding LacI/PurR family transcriptional regulator
MTTIKDVAQAAQVSTATVSHVINGTRYVSEEVKRRVLQAMERLNYQPNAIARGLRTKKTHLLALVIPDITNAFFTDLARGFQDAADQKDYVVVVCNTDRALDRELRFLDMLRQQRVDGLVLNPAMVTAEDLKRLLRAQIAVVLIGSQIDDPDFDLVMVDNVRGGSDAVQYLIDLGHRRIGLVSGPMTTSSGSQRCQGYRQALERNSLPYTASLVVEASFTYEGGYEGMQKLLRLDPLPTAVFATSDVMALGVKKAIEDAGLRIPDDLSLIGFDDIPRVSLIHPMLTTIAQPRYQMGWEAAQMLIERVEHGSSLQRRKLVMEHRLVVRESTQEATF